MVMFHAVLRAAMGLGFNWSKPDKADPLAASPGAKPGRAWTDGGDRGSRVFWSIQKAF